MTNFKSVTVLSTAALVLQLACLLDSPCAHAVVLVPRLSPATRFEIVRQLRGGQDDGYESDDEEEDLDDLEVSDDLETSDAGVGDGDDAALENPFLSGAAPDASAQLSGLTDTLKDPSLVREALKELQDPAAQARMRAMMEDPDFQKSMQQYVEQISKDPQFEQSRRVVKGQARSRAGGHPPLQAHPLAQGCLWGRDGSPRRLGAEARLRRRCSKSPMSPSGPSYPFLSYPILSYPIPGCVSRPRSSCRSPTSWSKSPRPSRALASLPRAARTPSEPSRAEPFENSRPRRCAVWPGVAGCTHGGGGRGVSGGVGRGG